MSEARVGWRRADAEASAALGALIQELDPASSIQELDPASLIQETAQSINQASSIQETARGTTSAAGQCSSPDQSSQTQSSPVQPPLWSEAETKAFIGEAGSLTSAHVDIAPQLEVAHGLAGIKLLGVASHGATQRLFEEHGEHGSARTAAKEEDDDDDDDDDDDEEDDKWEEEEGGRPATCIPTDRPLQTHEEALLDEPEVTLVRLMPGDCVAFSSAALHFASNGADEMNAALYHGLVTEASLPRLQEAARREGALGEEEDVPFGVLSAADVLRDLEEVQ